MHMEGSVAICSVMYKSCGADEIIFRSAPDGHVLLLAADAIAVASLLNRSNQFTRDLNTHLVTSSWDDLRRISQQNAALSLDTGNLDDRSASDFDFLSSWPFLEGSFRIDTGHVDPLTAYVSTRFDSKPYSPRRRGVGFARHTSFNSIVPIMW